MTTHPTLWQRLSRLLVEKLDLTFTLGRVFGLLPVLILSRRVADQAVLAEMVSDYQVALFLSTIVLYGGPQVYLVKQGLERRVFIFHMALSSVLFTLGLLAFDAVVPGYALVWPFVYLVFFRSYYLLLASYLKFHPKEAFFLIGMAVASVAVFAVTLDYLWATLVAAGMMGWFLWRQGYLRLRFALVALRQYVPLLLRNSGYFITFLLQQTYTQITLVAYALVAGGTDYLLATHAIYIFALSFVAHNILFRFTLAKMGQKSDMHARRRHLTQNVRLSLALGAVAAATVVLFYRPIELLLFGSSYMTLATSAMLAGMILLNSSNFGWSALFMSVRRPFLLASIAVVSTVIVIAGVFLLAWLDIRNGLFYAMLAGLLVQAIFRNLAGLRLMRQAG